MRCRHTLRENTTGHSERVRFWLLIGWCWFFSTAHALEREYVFRTLESSDGLAQNTVNALLQDRAGFLWIGTQGGLHRYDGVRLNVYQHDPARQSTLPDSLITALAEREDGQIWVGTDGAGVALLDPGSGRSRRQELSAVRGSASERITALLDTPAGLWVGSRAGLGLYDPRSGTTRSVLNLRSDGTDAINALLLDARGRLWIGTTASGLWSFKGGKPERFTEQSLGAVRALATDTTGRLLLATSSGLWELDAEQSLLRRRPEISGDLNALALAPDGAIWVAIAGRGLARVDLRSAHITQFGPDPRVPGSLPESGFIQILIDRAGLLWCGGQTRGVTLADTAGAPFKLLIDDQTPPPIVGSARNGNLIRTLYARGSMLWIGTDDEGLKSYDLSAQRFARVQPAIEKAFFGSQAVRPMRISALAPGDGDKLYVGTSLGLAEYDPKTGSARQVGKQSLQDPVIRSLLRSRDGSLWIGSTNQGLTRYEPGLERWEYIGVGKGELPHGMVLTLHEDRLGRIWAGTLNGLAVRERAAESWRQFHALDRDPRALPGNLLRSILEQRDGTLWFGTHSGLARLDELNPERALFSRFTVRDGLPNPTIYGVLEDKLGRLWLSSNGGIALFAPDRGSWRSFDLQDGLQGLEYNGGAALALSDGVLAFGGVNGLNTFVPERISQSEFDAPVRLISVQSGRAGPGRVPHANQLAVPYQDRVLRLEFAVLDYRAPKRNRYAYRLEGFDSNWVLGKGLGVATYTNLPPGRYRFRVRGSNRDERWSERELALAIHIIPPWWSGRAARTAYCVLGAVGALALMLIYHGRRRVERRFVGALRESEDQLRLSLWGSRDLYWDFDLTTLRIRRDAAEPVLGPGMNGEFDAQNFLAQHVHPDDHPALLQTVDKLLNQGLSEFSVEHRMRNSAGEWVWVVGRGQVVARNAAGVPSRVAGTARNIQQAREAERELTIAGRVIDRMSEAVAVSSEAERFVKVNPAFELMTGYRAEEVLGQPLTLLQSSKHDALQYRSIQELVQRDGRWRGEMWQRRKDASDFLVSIEVTRIDGRSGEPPLQVAVLSDITDRKRAEEELRLMASFDALTGLPNRTLLLQRLSRAISRSRRHRQSLAVLFLDLDRFKQINDSLGHAAGDELLRAVAARMREAVREVDTVARLAGDEFVLLIEELEHSRDAQIAAARVIERFTLPFNLSGTDVVVSPSIGMALFPDDADKPDELLKCADLAMYAAKAAGRNTVRSYHSEQSDAAHERAATESLLRRALEKAQFELYYQPSFELASGRVVGVEALLRWHHPQRGMVSPDAFVPILEESGLIVPIGLWVLDQALAQLRAWDDAGLTGLYMSVNVSMLQLTRGELVLELPTLLERHKLEGARLTLELTESLVMANPAKSIATLNRLCELGPRIAVDDFGTGYSSLAYLKRLPIDKLKIDKAFVHDLGINAEDTAITHSILALAHALELECVAEGVEHPAQVELLRAQGCHEAQGYYYCVPLPADACSAFLAKHRAELAQPPCDEQQS